MIEKLEQYLFEYKVSRQSDRPEHFRRMFRYYINCAKNQGYDNDYIRRVKLYPMEDKVYEIETFIRLFDY